MIRSVLVFLVLAGCAAAAGCNKQKAGTAESNTEPAKAAASAPGAAAAAPNPEPTSVPNEPPPADLNDESAGVKDPPEEEPGEDPKGEDEDDESERRNRLGKPLAGAGAERNGELPNWKLKH